MKIALFAVAESSSLDTQKNRVSMFHILDGLGIASVPAIFPSLALVTIARREVSEAEQTYSCVCEITCGSQSLAQIPVGLSFDGRTLTRNVVTIQGVPVPEMRDLIFTLR